MQAFRADSPLVKGIRIFVDLLFLSMLWVLCSLPVLTLGLSTAALMDLAHRNIVRTDGILFLDWFRSIRKNWKLTLPTGALFAAAIGLQAADAFLLRRLLQAGSRIGLAWPLFLITGAVTIGLFLWTLFCCNQYDSSWKETLKNGVFLAIANLPLTAVLVLTVLAAALLIWLIPAGLFVLPALAALACGELIRRAMVRSGYLEKDPDPEKAARTEAEPNWRK